MRCSADRTGSGIDMRRKTISYFFALLGCAIPLPLTGCARAQPRKSAERAIRYEVTGTAQVVALTYQNNTGGTNQIDRTVPWFLELNVKPGSFICVAARNKGSTGTMMCRILVDSEVFKSAESSGAYKRCVCSGIISP
jgi:hypothetical protein